MDSQRSENDEDLPTESTPLMHYSTPLAASPKEFPVRFQQFMNDQEDEEEMSIQEKAAMFDRQSMAADHLSTRLLQIPDDDSEEEERILRQSLDLSYHKPPLLLQEPHPDLTKRVQTNLCALFSVALVALVIIGAISFIGYRFVGPPRQPIGPYRLIERQEGMAFFDYYNFYEGRDSAGSNGYLQYVSMERAKELEILNITVEEDVEDVYAMQHGSNVTKTEEPFVYMGSAPTPEGPRESIRLEGKRRFNRGLFVIDLRHMPAGCGVWPAFWLTDEANWPVNGEIDIVEGVNYQSMAKTALHSTRGCSMNDVPAGVKTGSWDTAVGIPDKKTGIPDMTLRYATDCFVYNPHQWLNQGCVAVDEGKESLGVPLNEKGGGVYVLEWDPIFRRIRSWVFTPHVKVPDNLRDAIRTASEPPESQVLPDPDLWPLPYGYFAVGDETDCPARHFRNMRLVFNMAFCGSVAGNRFQLDCPKQAKHHKTCNDWIKSEPDELQEAYWKVRGVYVYGRDWERAWL